MERDPQLSDFYNSKMSKNYIYHYTKADIAIEKILYDGTLKFGSLINTNDPQETRGWSGFLDRTPEKDYLMNSQVAEKFNVTLRQQILTKYKISCFSYGISNNDYSVFTDGAGWCHPRMWAQYAADNKGVCLVFNKDRLISSVVGCFGKDNVFSKKIDYYTHVKQLPKPGELIDNVESYIEKHKNEIFFSKYSDWKDENEFRVVVKSSNQAEEFVRFENSLAGIIVGVDFSIEAYRVLLENICSKYRCCYGKMFWINGVPSLNKI